MMGVREEKTLKMLKARGATENYSACCEMHLAPRAWGSTLLVMVASVSLMTGRGSNSGLGGTKL